MTAWLFWSRSWLYRTCIMAFDEFVLNVFYSKEKDWARHTARQCPLWWTSWLFDEIWGFWIKECKNLTLISWVKYISMKVIILPVSHFLGNNHSAEYSLFHLSPFGLRVSLDFIVNTAGLCILGVNEEATMVKVCTYRYICLVLGLGGYICLVLGGTSGWIYTPTQWRVTVHRYICLVLGLVWRPCTGEL